MEIAAAAIIGLILGAIISTLFLRLRTERLTSQLENENAILQERLSRIPELEELIQEREGALSAAHNDFVKLHTTISQLQTRLEEERKSAS